MATKVQEAFGYSAGSPLSFDFGSAITSGNDVIVISWNSNSTAHTDVTIGGTSGTNDFTTNTAYRVTRRRVSTGGVTNVTVSATGGADLSAIAIEVSGLQASSPLDATTAWATDTATTLHQLPITNSGANRLVLGFTQVAFDTSWTAANGSEVVGWFDDANSTNAMLWKDAVGTGPQTIDVTTDNFAVSYFVVSYINDTGGGGSNIPRLSFGLRQQLNN